jgi:hypothetical protein
LPIAAGDDRQMRLLEHGFVEADARKDQRNERNEERPA